MSEELSIIDVLKLLGKYKKYILKNKFKIIIGVLLIFSFLTYKFLKEKPSFNAEITFTTPDKKGGKMNSALAMAKQFGIIGGGGGGELSTPVIMELLASKKIVREGLFSEITIKGVKDFAINHYVRLNDIKNKEKEQVIFERKVNVFQGSREEEKVIKKILGVLIKKGLDIQVSDESGIVSLGVNSIDEEFSIEFAHSLVHALKTNYVEKSIERQKNTYESLNYRVDSIKNLMEETEANYARLVDSKLNVIKAEGKLKEGQLMREIKILNVIYSEGIKNLEIARFNLLDETPVIQVIDQPTLPLKNTQKGLVVSSVLNMFLSGFLVIVIFSFLFGFKVLKSKMNDATD